MKNFIFMMLTFARCQGYQHQHQHQHQDKTSVFRQNAPTPSTTLKCPHDAAEAVMGYLDRDGIRGSDTTDHLRPVITASASTNT